MYKNKEKQKEANRLIKQKSREGVTKGVTLLKRPNQMGENGLPEMVDNMYDPTEMWQGSKRYLKLSDGQVLDRKTVPFPSFNPPVGGFIPNKPVLPPPYPTPKTDGGTIPD